MNPVIAHTLLLPARRLESLISIFPYECIENKNFFGPKCFKKFCIGYHKSFRDILHRIITKWIDIFIWYSCWKINSLFIWTNLHFSGHGCLIFSCKNSGISANTITWKWGYPLARGSITNAPEQHVGIPTEFTDFNIDRFICSVSRVFSGFIRPLWLI